MRTEYHDPALVKAMGKAIVLSGGLRESVVVRMDAGNPVVRMLCDDPSYGTRFVFNGWVCEEQREGRPVRRTTFSPVAFRCDWEDA